MKFLCILLMVFAASTLIARPTGEPSLDVLLRSVEVNESISKQNLLLTNWDCSICFIKIQTKNK